MKKLLFTFTIVLTAIAVLSAQEQDATVKRNTRVADILAQFPARDVSATDKLISELLAFGEPVLKQVCEMIVPPSGSDDTKPRFAVESISRYLSDGKNEDYRAKWEAICIYYAGKKTDNYVKDFFMKQLQIIGREPSVDAVRKWLTDANLCSPAVSVIAAVGGKKAELALAEALADPGLPCSAQVMNTLAAMKSELALEQYIARAKSKNLPEKAAALNALAVTGNRAAYPILEAEAKLVKFRWEHTGATEALLTYCSALGEKGDLQTMEKICSMLIKSCTEQNNVQYKTSALSLLAKYLGEGALSYLIDAGKSTDIAYRNAAMALSANIGGERVVKRWLDFYPAAPDYSKPEILRMFASMKTNAAEPVFRKLLNDKDPAIRKEALYGYVAINGKGAFGGISDYMKTFKGEEDQSAAGSALLQIADTGILKSAAGMIGSMPPEAKVTLVRILAGTGDNRYFKTVAGLTGEPAGPVREAALNSLQNLASQSDQQILISMLLSCTDQNEIPDLQSAVAVAAQKEAVPERRSDVVLGSITDEKSLKLLLPVLGRTGTRKAIERIISEFEKGNEEIRNISFDALSSWNGVPAASALYRVVEGRDPRYYGRAFDGYLRQTGNPALTDEQRVLLCRNIMPFADTPERKKAVLKELSSAKVYQALFFAGTFLDVPEVSDAAARAVVLIALPGSDNRKGLTGVIARELLTKAIPLLKGPEADYERELVKKYIDAMPSDEGFVKIFNGKDLTGWQGLVADPIKRTAMKPSELAAKQAEANRKMLNNWSVKDGMIWFSGNGDNLCTVKKYGDFEMLVDWKITKKGDSGIYLRGSPQVQIWDTSRTDAGAQVGSGGLYNNQKNPSKPLLVADNQVGEWNSFRILMTGEKVSVWLNGILVTDNVVLENYWDRSLPIFATEAIELQAHGTDLAFRDIYVREINEKNYMLTPEEIRDGFSSLFNGRNLDNWIGDKTSYVAEDEMIVIRPSKGSGGNLYTSGEYSDFVFRFDFQLTPGANNGLGIRAPLEGDAAYAGMELQILDDTAPVYASLQPYQYHGSVYGVIPSKRGYLKPVGEWNSQEVIARGNRITVILNGTVIVDGDIAEASASGTMDHREHPGLKNQKGHIGFLGHGSVLKFRNIRIKDLSKK